jgi:hypothetical protein
VRAVTGVTTDFESKMAGAQQAERTVEICLRGDLVAELQDLERQAMRARADRSPSKEDATAADFVAQILAKQAEMREAAEVFRLRPLSPRKYRALREQHPPRRDDKGEPFPADVNVGFNMDTFPHALIPLCAVTPQLTDEKWRQLLGDSDTSAAALEAEGKEDEILDGLVTYSQYMDLVNACYILNEGDVSVPFSPAALLTSRDSDDE